MGNFLEGQRERKDPCFESLNAYVSCVERHQGQAPDPYETEWCLEEQAAYLACRQGLKAPEAASASDSGKTRATPSSKSGSQSRPSNGGSKS